ncbi:hypothetical protein Q5P01_006374 [Channa striata]|uniref:Mucin-15 n=1 Tax=Channa striata TaxID=64152 RepID=A0AA88SYP2_CHASR|nr:hypothetical protein Q5P01_006374 [Channa striata]
MARKQEAIWRFILTCWQLGEEILLPVHLFSSDIRIRAEEAEMGAYLKITAGLLLFIQAFQLASLQESTDSTGITIDKSWLRHLPKNSSGTPNATVNEEDTIAMDQSSGIASGFMASFSEEEQNLIGHNETFDDLEDPYSLAPNDTTKKTELPSSTVSPTPTTTLLTNSTQINETEAEDGFHNSTQTPQLSTTLLIPNNSNLTDLQSTTLDPELTNATESSGTTTATTTTTTETNETSTVTISSTTVVPSETPETSTVTITTTTVNTPVKANITDKDAAPGGSSERGFASDSQHNKKYVAWAAILGTAVAVISVGLVIYIVLKNRRDKGFSHRKLVEDYPSEPVHRLDNNEPLDLTFGGSAYYNPALQGDNIQMTNFPGQR